MLKGSILASIALVVAFVFVLSSCTKTETKTNKPAPTITLSATTAQNVAGAQVSTNVTVDSPEGGATLLVTVNGVVDAAFTGGTLDGTTSQQITYNYTIPANAAVGTVYTVSFQSADKKAQNSASVTFTVTVSAVPAKTIVEVGTNGKSTYITANTTWTADKIWRIHGFVRVGVDTIGATAANGPLMQTTGVVLTIEPGTVILGAQGSPGGTLIIQRGSQINAVGTAAKPIIFTSEKAPTTRKAGDWGGLVLCGKASNNIKGSSATHVDGVEELEGSYRGYHGGGASPSDTDNSGTLKYVRVEFAGYPIFPNQEINGITFGSVGAGTTFSYVQVSYSNDDSFEWFGGSAQCDHLIAYKGLDDDFDTDNGFHGMVQFGLGIRDQAIADQSGSNGFESDNDAAGSYNTPFTTAVFSNMTIIGGKAAYNTPIDVQFQNVAQIRRNSKLNIINSFFTGYPNGIFIDNALPTTSTSGYATSGQTFPQSGTVSNAADGSLSLHHNVLAGVERWGGNGFGSIATANEIANVTGLPNSVPPSASPNDPDQTHWGNFNHSNAPRGLIVAVGGGGFTTGVFGFTTPTEQTIGGANGPAWFKANNTFVKAWNDASIGINANIFEPLNGTPTLIPTGSLMTSGTGFTLPAGTSAVTTNLKTNVTYKGAFGTDGDWTTGWANWTPQLTDYSK